MITAEIIIIGAGATGLMAARTLSKAGKKLVMLEARNRCGGRIHTLNQELFFKNAEVGAEFIHGNLPVTLSLLKEAKIPYHPATAEMWHYKNGAFNKEGAFKDWYKVIEKLSALTYDTNIKAFLEEEFPGDKNELLKTSVIKFVSGYDTADPARASAFALREEWRNEDDGAQHRIEGGYGVLIKYLEDECKKAGTGIYLNSVVKEIHWQPGMVRIITDDGITYEASRAIIALPLGVLQAGANQTGVVRFIPEIPGHLMAIRRLGFGSIIKILLEFDEPFWEAQPTGDRDRASLKNMGFVLSDEIIPTWWTQLPQRSTVLTGWLGGLPAAEKAAAPSEEILKEALASLSNIFSLSAAELKDKLVAWHIANWTADPFTRGSYAYDTVAAREARKTLTEPVGNTLFFAGEYLYEGPAMGTVEAALTSGLNVAEKIALIPIVS